MKDRVLIIGKTPPPIGGVTIHVRRLLEQLKVAGFTHFDFLDLNDASLLKIIKRIFSHHIIHLHTSNPYFQLLTALLSRFTGKILILTFHGNIGRYGKLRNMLTALSCKYCTVPIVQNESSELLATQWNPATIRIGAYIPATFQELLSPATSLLIQAFATDYEYLFCTNASTLSFDSSGREIYGISELIDAFVLMPKAGLIISDSSGQYFTYIRAKRMLPRNVCFISTPHDFLNILDYSDAMIRNTTTDGDSISVHEALEKGLVVFATDCVPRPKGCKIYQSVSELDVVSELEEALMCKRERSNEMNVTGTLVCLYNSYLHR
jgi:glycosyltransferase involved in cell wall biosynthesis